MEPTHSANWWSRQWMKEECAFFGAQNTRAATIEMAEKPVAEDDGAPARSSESTPGTSRSAVPPLEHPQCKGGPDGLTPGARRQLASPRVLQWSARGRIAPKPSLRSVSFFFSGFGLAITSYPPIPKDVDYNLPSIGLLG